MKFIVGLAAAGAIGTIAGVMLAPHSGKETRSQVRGKGRILGRRMKAWYLKARRQRGYFLRGAHTNHAKESVGV